MKKIFADTLYWIARLNPRDPYHQKAKAVDKMLSKGILITTDEVLVEFLTFFRTSAALRQAASSGVRRILANPNVKVLPQTRKSFEAGLEMYEQRPDKQYSLTDCVSMVTMQREGIREILTRDHHFQQEGFKILL